MSPRGGKSVRRTKTGRIYKRVCVAERERAFFFFILAGRASIHIYISKSILLWRARAGFFVDVIRRTNQQRFKRSYVALVLYTSPLENISVLFTPTTFSILGGKKVLRQSERGIIRISASTIVVGFASELQTTSFRCFFLIFFFNF